MKIPKFLYLMRFFLIKNIFIDRYTSRSPANSGELWAGAYAADVVSAYTFNCYINTVSVHFMQFLKKYMDQS